METDEERRARRERRLLGPTAEQIRDRQVARETVRPRSECPHCNPTRRDMTSDLVTAPNCKWASENHVPCPHVPNFVVQPNPLRDEGEFEFACTEHLGIVVTEVIGREHNEGLTVEVITVEDFFASEEAKHKAEADLDV